MYKLLVVDDEVEIRTGLCKYFPWDDIGFEVVGQAENGREALFFIREHQVDVILCDIKMPVLSGIELAAELNAQKSKTKVIFLSGYRDFEYAQKALSYGVRDYIVKSTKYNELVSVFKKVKEELDEETTVISEERENHQDTQTEAGSYHERVILAIKNYVNEHFRDVELEDIAKLVHMSPDYVSKLFKIRSGQNFSDFLLSVRMEKAVEFLREIGCKTYEVSERLGYTNVKNFTRTFKNYYGISPREFRNNEELNRNGRKG